MDQEYEQSGGIMSKWQSIIFGVIVFALIVGTFYVAIYQSTTGKTIVNISGDREKIVAVELNKNQLTWNDVKLRDDTIYNSNLSCQAGHNGMSVYIPVCNVTTHDGVGITHEAYFTTNRSEGTTYIFAYDGKLTDGALYWFHNYSHQYQELNTTNVWINNYLVDGIINYSNLGSPNLSSNCQVGNNYNTKMYLVNRIDNSTTFQSAIWCFTNITTINSTSFRISGNITNNQILTKTGYKFDYDDITNIVSDITSNVPSQMQKNFTFYKIEDVNAGTYPVKWVYTPKNNATKGKFHIFAYPTTKGIIQSYQDGDYMYQDPNWDYTTAVVSNWSESFGSTGSWGRCGMSVVPTNGNATVVNVSANLGQTAPSSLYVATDSAGSIGTTIYTSTNFSGNVALFPNGVVNLTNGTQYWFIVPSGTTNTYGGSGSPAYNKIDHGLQWTHGWNPTISQPSGSLQDTNGGYCINKITIAYMSSTPDDANYPKFTNIANLTTPVNYSASANYSFSTTITSTNGTAYLTLNNVNYSLSNSTTNFSTSIVGLNVSSYNYSFYAYGNGTSHNYNSSIVQSFTIRDPTSPALTLNAISNVSTMSLPYNVTLNASTSDPYIANCTYWTSENATPIFYTCNTTKSIAFSTGGYKNLTVFANDTYSNSNTSTVYFYIYYFNASVSATNPAVEGSTSTNILTLNMTNLTLLPQLNATAYLIWNGTNYGSGSRSVIDNNTYQWSNSFTVPTLNATFINYTWFYNITGDSAFSNPYNKSGSQTYSAINFSTTCGNTTSLILNYTLFDQGNKTMITGDPYLSLETDMLLTSVLNSSTQWIYHAKVTNTNPVQICLPATVLNTSAYILDSTTQYSSTGRTVQYHYIDSQSITNSSIPMNINLYDLSLVDSTTFLFEFQDANGLPVQDALVDVYRYYIGDGVYRSVERARTDFSGQTHVHLVEEDVIYYFQITKDNATLYTSPTYNAKCLSAPCTIKLTANPSTNFSIVDNEGGRYTITANKTSRMAFVSFQLQSVDTVNATLYKYTDGNIAVINRTSAYTTGGVLSMPVPLSYGNDTFFVAIERNGTFIKSGWVDLTTSGKDIFGTSGAIFGGLIVLAIVLMAVSEGIGLIIFTCFALIIIGIMALVDLGWLAIISIICAGAIIVFKLIKRRRGG